MAIRRFSLLRDEAQLRHLRRLLNQEELRRADRFVAEKLTRRFIAARAGLRSALGEAIGLPGKAVEFEYGPMGKPRLVHATSNPPLHFNLAHSGEHAIVAISRQLVGVDLEVVRPMPRAAAFAERWFHPAERTRLNGKNEEDRLREFFRIWTAKEAALKLLGKGVGEALPKILTPEGDGWVTELPANEFNASRCAIRRIDDAPMIAAIATPHPVQTIHFDRVTEQ